MIGYLQGIVKHIEPKKILIYTPSGVGYEVFPTANLLGNAKKEQPIEAFIHTIVREQEISLYGFFQMEEKALFEKMIGVSGIGPKIALVIVSGNITQFVNAIEQGQTEIITQTPGIGKKMAQKIILELKGKIDLSNSEGSLGSQNPALDEAIEALCNLGYDSKSVTNVLEKVRGEISDTENLIKYFLSSNA